MTDDWQHWIVWHSCCVQRLRSRLKRGITLTGFDWVNGSSVSIRESFHWIDPITRVTCVAFKNTAQQSNVTATLQNVWCSTKVLSRYLLIKKNTQKDFFLSYFWALNDWKYYIMFKKERDQKAMRNIFYITRQQQVRILQLESIWDVMHFLNILRTEL